jgi:type IV pilus assembly protein PilF
MSSFVRLLMLALVGVLLGVGLWGCAADRSKPGAYQGAYATKQSDEIVTASDEPELRRRARLRLELAVGYFEQGQVTVALDEVKQVLSLDPSFVEAHNLRGLIYMRLNDPRLAEESFKRALALAPHDADVLHNYGWFLCQSARYPESFQVFAEVLDKPQYPNQVKTLLARGLCEARSGDREHAELSLARAYELDAGNPVTGYNLALLLYQRGEYARAQFYIRRLNNTELANAGSFWLGIRVERHLGNQLAMQQLADQLKRRFPQSKEAQAYERGAFDE